jgi:hypothetical protein
MTKLKLLREAFEPTESEIRKSIQRYLDLKGIFNWRQWQGQFSVPGVPDIVGILPGSGRILGIEVKRPGGKPSDLQVKFMEDINRSGGVAFVASSVEDVITKLQIKSPLK